ncbi:hypothetical protein [Yoonia sp. 208BN28-4]|uniref:hypothetical protein n=1 Tax=Yoonia sp. 208BN28-4 TaxID=3126505 RepID=UPI00309486BE
MTATMVRDNFHSQLVVWAKIILPLSALALLSTLFLFARAPSEEPAIPISDIAAIARDQSISAPRFSGVADDGSIVSIAARNARPDPAKPSEVVVDALSLSLDAPDGSRVDVTSGASIIDTMQNTALLEGLARLTTSSGYVMETNGLRADLNTGIITSDGALEIQAPYGELTAGRIRIAVTSDGEGQQMLFTDGVRLLYTPNNLARGISE